MLIGYARISKADGSQSLDLQRDALREAGVSDDAIYEDQASGQREDRRAVRGFAGADAAARRSGQGLKAVAGADRSAGRGFEAAGQTLGEGLQRDRRSVERSLNHIQQIQQQRFGPERDFGPSR